MAVAALALLLATPLVDASADASALEGFRYVSPIPGATRVSPDNNVILRPAAGTAPDLYRDLDVTVRGAISGSHDGEWVLSDDGETLVFNPRDPFSPGERVTVTVAPRPGAVVPVAAQTFSFQVSRVHPRLLPRPAPWDGVDLPRRPGPGPASAPATPASGAACDSLPAEYPPVTFPHRDFTYPGFAFFAPFALPPTRGHLLITDERGVPYFYRTVPDWATDFKRQPGGLLTYFAGDRYWGLDSTYAVVDSFAMGNGYGTDLHGLQVLADGHALLTAYDPQPVRMDSVVAGGDSLAVVTGYIVQELDTAGNVVFQWRSWDHFEITDGAVSGYVDLTAESIDYCHGNAVELDEDGNLLISCRHMNEITKIDRSTGDVIWRWGMHAVNNDFTFVNDTRGFSHQHDVRRLPNGNITLFDNGNFLAPEYSRALEYALDEDAMTATLVWEYDADQLIFGPFMGSVQKFSDGSAMIGWGGTPYHKLRDMRSDGSIGFEAVMPDSFYTYRAFRHPWRTTRFTADSDTLDFGNVAVGNSLTLPLVLTNAMADTLAITCMLPPDTAFSVVEQPPLHIPPGDTATVHVTYTPPVDFGHGGFLHLRSVDDTELVAQVVFLSGNGGIPVSAGKPPAPPPGPVLHAGTPNPFRVSSAVTFSLPEEQQAALRVYDVSGRLVRTLIEGPLVAGTHRLVWDARDDRGREAGAGVYFFRLETPNGSQTRRLVRLGQ